MILILSTPKINMFSVLLYLDDRRPEVKQIRISAISMFCCAFEEFTQL